MSFVSVDFFGARAMADEIEAMGRDCAAMAKQTGVSELDDLMADLTAIAADVRRACDKRETLDSGILDSMKPDYKGVME